jgi:hypothetical protein
MSKKRQNKTLEVHIFLISVFLMSGCSASGGQSKVKPTSFAATSVQTTDITVATIMPASTPNPNFIITNSPDGKYSIELNLSGIPSKLIISDNNSDRKTELLLAIDLTTR